jgi:GAF domain-containing protein
MMRRVQKDVRDVHKTSDRVFTQLLQMQALVDTSALITSSLDLDQVLDGVIDTVIKLTGAERAYLMLRDADSGQLSIRAARNWDQQSMSSGEVVFSEGVIQSALEQGTPIVTVNAQDDARFQDRASVMSHGLRSILCIPLVLREDRIGVLYADNRVSLGVFQEESLPLLTAFANQAAIAIENARLFERVKADLDKAEREVQVLRLQIDRDKLSRQVSEITESEYFQQLEDMARNIRAKSDKDDEE